ncbi:MAG: hypothetical protein FH748_01820 [Balneolaceae bacterium]|nr:hypothetical protein [Balneolaceae bacterium]
MKNKLLLSFLFSLILNSNFVFAQEAPKLADQIVAQVNDHIILKSEIDRGVADYINQARVSNQPIEFSEELWYTFLENEIDKYVVLEQARLDSVTVSDDKVNREMDNRVQSLVQRAGSEKAVEEAFGKSILQLKVDFREDFRQQMVNSKMRQLKISEIEVTRPEVQQFFNSIPEDSLPTIPEQVALSQIVIIPPPLENADSEAYEFAQQLRDSIVTHGKSIEELAKRHSDGPSGKNGGLIQMTALDMFVSEYSAAAAALEPGEISKVVKTQFGYHIIRLNKRVGDEIETNQILIKVDDESLDDEYAIDRLNTIRDSLLSNEELDFAQVARALSEDPNSANRGGKLFDPQTGERLIPLNRLDPALYRIVLLMDEPGQISKPKEFETGNTGKAFRIVRLDRQIPEHEANIKQDYDRIKQITLQQKQVRLMQEWIQNLRDKFYIEYKIPVPGKETTP